MTGSSSILSQCLLQTYIHTHSFYIHTQTHAHVHTCKHTHKNTNTCIYTHTQTYIHTLKYTHTYAHIASSYLQVSNTSVNFTYEDQIPNPLATVGIFVKSCNVIKFINNEMWFITCIKFQKIFSHTKHHF